MLTVKPNQNMIVDLESSRYNELLRPMVECLKYSRISKALTKSESVPVVHLSSAYSSAVYNKKDEIINFEVASHKTSISKSRFFKLLRFTSLENLVDPESISSVDLQRMFWQMGYKGDISLLSKFKKFDLPPNWNALFTILFKSFSERVTGIDTTSRLFYTIIYGLYNDINLDYGSVLWNQFVQSLTSSSRHSEVSCARFWSIVVHRAYSLQSAYHGRFGYGCNSLTLHSLFYHN
ncbi:hypothetical protein L2E82_03685 [Cichorium intybus]|uniref:Uncharacterized protein n=1 Tax=Cichorium intybus TaxID=13427 RepID=A0ACB9H5G3_CICIN|nr:hypothetical protein L2E82_03685 [Cichorium intybus]